MPSTIKGDQSIHLPLPQQELSENVSKIQDDFQNFEQEIDKNYELTNTQDFFTLGSPNNVREKETKPLTIAAI